MKTKQEYMNLNSLAKPVIKPKNKGKKKIKKGYPVSNDQAGIFALNSIARIIKKGIN